MSATVLGYYGSKVRTAPRIIEHLPTHHGYVEPFCGALGVLLAKPAARFEVVNDLDGDLMLFWRVLRDQPEDLARVCALTPHSRAEYEASWPITDDPDDLERARRVWVKLTQGRAGSLRTTGWRYHEAPLGRSSSMPRTLAGYVGRFAQVADRLSTVTLECLPALEVIARYGRDPHNLLYVDPPYLGDVRNGTAYRHEMPHEAEHRKLAAALTECKSAVVISGYAHPLYDANLYAGWSRAEIAAATGQGSVWNARTEVIWSNRPLQREHTLDFTDALEEA